MRGVQVAAGVLASVAVVGSVCTATPANASNYGIELNGKYRVISNGEWARTNQVLIDQQTVVQTWDITSSCESPIECTGEVRSDQGWTAPIRMKMVYWILNREVPNWIPCPDGTSAPGMQKFVVWGINPTTNERDLKIRDLLAGRDITEGPSGACGVNKPVDIELPVRMEKIS
ncbi:hypothetical protein [Mycobacterium hubeiense]|uniref:hypothetical protein n=1 Tax=Mycobacterium hubeiense TaxID=1867256 RepID=UPI000C7E9162|nr:hypothetical protein [Mycobacterium sp. QGD 101]